jgi:hypothetical protein
MLLYLHGFRSTPQSRKAQQIAARMAALGRADEYVCPQLPASPRAAAQLLEDIAARVPVAQLAVIGSSLGGYYATWLAEQTGCRAVLLNPAVHAARDLATRVGIHTGWHEPEKPFEFKAAYLDELRALAVAAITVPRRYYTLIAKGDEVLDWREMSAHYPGTAGRLLEGSDHALTEFAAYLDEILSFLELDPQPAA